MGARIRGACIYTHHNFFDIHGLIKNQPKHVCGTGSWVVCAVVAEGQFRLIPKLERVSCPHGGIYAPLITDLDSAVQVFATDCGVQPTFGGSDRILVWFFQGQMLQLLWR
jgi:hypothetical protein